MCFLNSSVTNEYEQCFLSLTLGRKTSLFVVVFENNSGFIFGYLKSFLKENCCLFLNLMYDPIIYKKGVRMSKSCYLFKISVFSLFLPILFVSSAFSVNLVLPANGGILEEYTSAYSDANSGHQYAEDLTDGILDDDGWCSTYNPGPQSFVYSFRNGHSASIDDVVIYSGTAGGFYFSRDIEVWTSVDGTVYTEAASGTLPATSESSITLSFTESIVARTVRLVITSGYRTRYWSLGEFEVNGDLMYPLTVNSGDGDGDFTEGSAVTITAGEAPSGMIFDHWIVDPETTEISEINNMETTLVMPLGAVTVEAIYEPIMYSLTVDNGDGGGDNPFDSVVAITAGEAPPGQEFDDWVVNSGDPSIDNVNASVALLTMGASDAEVIATYRFVGSSVSADFEVDAGQDTDGDSRWENLVAGNPSGVDFELDNSSAVTRVTDVSSFPGITAAYDFPGGFVGNEGGALLRVSGTSTAMSSQDMDGDWSDENVTIEIWFQPDDISTDAANGEILFEDGGGTGFGFFMNNNLLQLRKAGGSGLVEFDITNIADEFIQVVGTYDVSTGTMGLFVNGIAGTDIPGGGDWGGSDGAGLGTLGGLNVGGIGSGQSSTESFNGMIAIFRMYRDRILTSTEIVENYIAVTGTVPDTTPPVINLAGANPMTLTQDDTYAEPGATATDNVDGDISVNISGTVNNGVVGSYTISYNVTDEAGNAATEVTRTVNVRDTTPPVITLLGANPMTLTLGDSYAESGATATDNVDGDISVDISGTVNTNEVGIYTISYNVTDEAGNAATEVTRTVNVQDTTPPVITLSGTNPMTQALGDAYAEPGATATDNVDVDIIVDISGTVNTNEVGSYTISYNVTDEAGNAATEVTRTVNVRDTTPPVINLAGANPMTLTLGDAYAEPGATATDNVDGDISVNISGTVNTGVVGIYTISYNVTDEAGNAATEVMRTVTIQDRTVPVIILTGSNPINLTMGGTYLESGAIATDNVDGDISGSIVISGAVNMDAVGSYTVRYNVSDAAENDAVEVTRTVNIMDGAVPEITLTGSNSMNLTMADTYLEPGATATDDVDGDISGSIVITGTVNMDAAGSYIVRYNVSNTAGNAATEVTRTVTVSTVTYSLTVINGAGEGVYYFGENVTITANEAPLGQVFDSWVVNSGSITFENENTASTTLIMLESDATITATYLENLILTDNGGVLKSFTLDPNSEFAAEELTDGELNGNGWSSIEDPEDQEFVYSFSDEQTATLNHAVLYSSYISEELDFNADVEVWTSIDGINYTILANDTITSLSENSIKLSLGNKVATAVKLVITSGQGTDLWELDEFEVYGVLENDQLHLESFPSYDGHNLIILETPEGTTVSGIQTTAPPEFVPADTEFSYGVFDFTIENIGAGGSTTATLYLPDDAAPTSYYNFGKTPDDETDHWYEFLYDETTGTGAEINENVITLHFVDGLRGDNDLDGTNGIIVDPGAPSMKNPDTPGEDDHNISTYVNDDEEEDDSGWSDKRGCFIESLF